MSLDDAIGDKTKAGKSRIKQLEMLVESQQERIAELTKKRFSFPAQRKGKKSSTYTRVVIPDTHGCFVDTEAAAAFLSDLDHLDPAEVVFLGDHLDCAGWLSKHHPFSTVQEARYTFEEDVDAANAFLDEVQQRTPNAEYHYIEGNHEERVEKFVVESTRQHPSDAAYLRKIFSPEAILHLEQRKMPYYRRTKQYCDLRRRGMLKLGHCYFVHGTTHAKHAAANHLGQHKVPIVFGHTHRRQQAGTSDVLTELDAWCPGCLCVLEPMWKHSQPTDWSHGYGLQIVSRDTGEFAHINAAIIDGRSFIPKPVFAPFPTGGKSGCSRTKCSCPFDCRSRSRLPSSNSLG